MAISECFYKDFNSQNKSRLNASLSDYENQWVIVIPRDKLNEIFFQDMIDKFKIVGLITV